MIDADAGRATVRERHLPLLEARQDHVVDHPPDREAGGDGRQREHRSADERRRRTTAGAATASTGSDVQFRRQAGRSAGEPCVDAAGSSYQRVGGHSVVTLWPPPRRQPSRPTATHRRSDRPTLRSRTTEPGRWRRSPVRGVADRRRVASSRSGSGRCSSPRQDRGQQDRGPGVGGTGRGDLRADQDRSPRARPGQAIPDLDGRADLVVESTDLLSAMLDDVDAVEPTDPKGQAIVPDWDRRLPHPARRTGTTTPSGSAPGRTCRSPRPPSRACRSPSGSRRSPATTRCPAARHHAPVCSTPRRTDEWRQQLLLITRAGTPAATQLSGRSPVTTLFAPTTTWRPIVAPGQHDRAVTEPRPVTDRHRSLGITCCRDREIEVARSRGSDR